MGLRYLTELLPAAETTRTEVDFETFAPPDLPLRFTVHDTRTIYNGLPSAGVAFLLSRTFNGTGPSAELYL